MDKAVSFIDAGLTSILQAGLHSALEYVNLHHNVLTRIEGLESLSRLVVLDLSANDIEHITGLDYLRSLKVLNLSCNCISAVQGLAGLRWV